MQDPRVGLHLSCVPQDRLQIRPATRHVTGRFSNDPIFPRQRPDPQASSRRWCRVTGVATNVDLSQMGMRTFYVRDPSSKMILEHPSEFPIVREPQVTSNPRNRRGAHLAAARNYRCAIESGNLGLLKDFSRYLLHCLWQDQFAFGDSYLDFIESSRPVHGCAP